VIGVHFDGKTRGNAVPIVKEFKNVVTVQISFATPDLLLI